MDCFYSMFSVNASYVCLLGCILCTSYTIELENAFQRTVLRFNDNLLGVYPEKIGKPHAYEMFKIIPTVEGDAYNILYGDQFLCIPGDPGIGKIGVCNSQADALSITLNKVATGKYLPKIGRECILIGDRYHFKGRKSIFKHRCDSERQSYFHLKRLDSYDRNKNKLVALRELTPVDGTRVVRLWHCTLKPGFIQLRVFNMGKSCGINQSEPKKRPMAKKIQQDTIPEKNGEEDGPLWVFVKELRRLLKNKDI